MVEMDETKTTIIEDKINSLKATSLMLNRIDWEKKLEDFPKPHLLRDAEFLQRLIKQLADISSIYLKTLEGNDIKGDKKWLAEN